jgi:hypothetical protein
MRSRILSLICLLGLVPATNSAADRRPAPAHFNQVRQGSAATAWLLAPVAAVQSRGIDLSKRVHKGGGTQFDIALYNYNNPHERSTAGMRQESYRVDLGGNTLDADPAIRPRDRTARWVVAMQRGLIEALRLWDPTQSAQAPHNGDPADALGMLTGHYPVTIAAGAADARPKVEAALRARKAVVYVTKCCGGHSELLLYPQPYAVLNAPADQVTLYNPMCYPQCVRALGGRKTLPWQLAVSEGDRFLIAETRFTPAERVSLKFNQLRQGKWGNCWMQASMAAVQYSGVDLARRIKRTGPNRYEVSLFNFEDPSNRARSALRPQVYPVDFDGKRVDADPSIWLVDHRNSDWAVVLYRGFVTAVRQWDPSQAIEAPHGGDPADALSILTGHYPVRFGAGEADARAKVEEALWARKPVVYCTKGDAKHLTGGHAHAVLKSSDKEMTLYNPGGFVQTASWAVASAEGDCFAIGSIEPVRAGAAKER